MNTGQQLLWADSAHQWKIARLYLASVFTSRVPCLSLDQQRQWQNGKQNSLSVSDKWRWCNVKRAEISHYSTTKHIHTKTSRTGHHFVSTANENGDSSRVVTALNHQHPVLRSTKAEFTNNASMTKLISCQLAEPRHNPTSSCYSNQLQQQSLPLLNKYKNIHPTKRQFCYCTTTKISFQHVKTALKTVSIYSSWTHYYAREGLQTTCMVQPLCGTQDSSVSISHWCEINKVTWYYWKILVLV